MARSLLLPMNRSGRCCTTRVGHIFPDELSRFVIFEEEGHERTVDDGVEDESASVEAARVGASGTVDDGHDGYCPLGSDSRAVCSDI
jgi:hypothetical protein